jgi:DNA-binding MarR family transcriptional regulator
MSEPTQLSQVLRHWTRVFMQRSFHDFQRFMEESDLSPSQTASLMRLYHCGASGVSDIGKHLGITRPAASQLVERMVQQGLLERAEDPHDRRFKKVRLTPKGSAVVEGGVQARLQWIEQLTARFTPEEQNTILAALTLLSQAAQKLEEG